MTKEKMTIHRGLAQLKLLDSRINKKIARIPSCGFIKKDGLVNDLYKKDDFEKNLKSEYESVLDLIRRKNDIKCAIVKANGETTIKVGGNAMKIADAINFKTLIKYKRALIERMEAGHRNTVSAIESHNAETDDKAIRLAEKALGKENIKLTDKDVENVVKPFLENNRLELVDPLGVEQRMVDLDTEVLEFESEVDAILSEANATTFINV